MSVKTVPALPARSLPLAGTDLLIVADPTTEIAYKATISNFPKPNLADLPDVNISSPTDGNLLQYYTSDSKWHNVKLITGGTF